MTKIAKHLIKKALLFLICGGIYYSLETIYKMYLHGYGSHFSMFILAGLCGVFCIDMINNIYTYELDFSLQVLISTFLCTIAEGICGCIINIKMGLGIWDYSNMPGKFFFDQCCIPFTIIWFILVIIFIPFCDAYNYYIFKDDQVPYYNLFGKRILTFKKRKV